MKWLYLGIAALAGAAMAVQGSLNSVLNKNAGIWPASLWVHVTGAITVLAILIWARAPVSSLFAHPAPWPAYLGGFLNVLIIWGVMKSMPAVGVGNATAAIVLLQLITALLVDNCGLLGLKKIGWSWWNLVGIVLMVIGARLILMKS